MRHSVELHPGGFKDPDGAHAAAVLTAYFHLEEVQDFRRLLYRQAAVLGIGALLATAAVPHLFGAVLEGGLGAIVVIGTGAGIVEHRAAARLKALIDRHER